MSVACMVSLGRPTFSSSLVCESIASYYTVRRSLCIGDSHDGRADDSSSCSGSEEESSPFYKWRLLISYDGTNYAGWQLQQKPATVQLMLETALCKATKLARESLVLTAASRTDTGVHAWGQVAHFQTPFLFEELQSLHASLNGILPHDIRIREVAAVHQEFHARYSTKKKTYQYKIFCAPVMDPFQWRYALHIREKLNVGAMREAAKFFVGQHDFKAFANVSRPIMKGDSIREIYRFDIFEKDSLLVLEVEGSGFLYKQVRNMVGLLLEIGRELVPASGVATILASQCRKLLAKYAKGAPPQGLTLMSIDYDKSLLEPPAGSPEASFGILQTHSRCKLFVHQ